jgi:3-dehydrosphinganine reductase
MTTILITGAASGIGKATAQLLAPTADLILWDINQDALSATASALNAQWATVDCTDYDQIQTALSTVETLHAVIHCAGVLKTGRFEQVSAAQHAKTAAINLTGTFHVVHATLPYLHQTRGHVVMIASVSAFYGPPEFATYAATKAGVLGFAQALRTELSDSGVHVGVVTPNLVNTPMLNEENRANAALTQAQSPFLKTYEPEDIAKVIQRGMKKRQFLIFPDWRSRLVYILTRYVAWIAPWLMRQTWRQAKK